VKIPLYVFRKKKKKKVSSQQMVLEQLALRLLGKAESGNVGLCQSLSVTKSHRKS
jgi:hypothetical protein